MDAAGWALAFTSISLVMAIGILATEKDQRDKIIQALRLLVREHGKELITRRRQLLLQDRYGYIDKKGWEKELDTFRMRVISPQVSLISSLRMPIPDELIEKILRDEFGDLIDVQTFEVRGSPIDYESYCCELLRSVGWRARLTQASGDQGADIIATKEDLKLVVQCKLYSRPVGNGAVQEASAARVHEGADYAAVVTNSTFTRAARSLAASNEIALVHHDHLQDYADKLSGVTVVT